MSLTIKQAAEKLGVSTKTVIRRINSGDIPCFKYGESRCAPVRILEKDLETYMEHCKVKA